MAKEWAVSEEHDGYANCYELDLDGLKILHLDQGYPILIWLTVLIQNRTFNIDSPLAAEVSRYLQKNFSVDTTVYDVITGYRADDSYFSFAQDFLSGTISYEQLQKAIRESYLEDFIAEQKNGLDTPIGERGMLISGGQKQRIGIARAFLKDAPILVLDEATSALDNQAEHIVQQAIDNLMKDRTVFVIAHRLSTIQNADRIAVINEGLLTELGTHEELMSIPNGE